MRWMLMLMVVVMAGCAGSQPSRFTDAQNRRARASMECSDAAEARVAGDDYAGWPPGETACLTGLVASACASREWAKEGSHEAAVVAAEYQAHVVERCGADLTRRVRAAFEAGL
ncbi:hypothetical protein ACLEPN_37815 [Myxococcus sp. 1LA]